MGGSLIGRDACESSWQIQINRCKAIESGKNSLTRAPQVRFFQSPFFRDAQGSVFLLRGEAGHSEIFFGMGRGGAGAKSSGHGTAGQS